MIVKSFEINKINNSHKIFLFYGENEGHKNEIIESGIDKVSKQYESIVNFIQSDLKW